MGRGVQVTHSRDSQKAIKDDHKYLERLAIMSSVSLGLAVALGASQPASVCRFVVHSSPPADLRARLNEGRPPPTQKQRS